MARESIVGENDILFGGIEIAAIEKHKSLEVAYSFYKSAYNKIVEDINAALEGYDRAERNLDGILDAAFHTQYSVKGENWKVLKNRYRDFVKQFIRLLEQNEPLTKQFAARGLAIADVVNWRDNVPNKRYDNRQLLQFMTCSKWVVDNVWSVYKHFRSSLDICKFAYDGCGLLHVTWSGFLNDIKIVAGGRQVTAIYHDLQEIIKGEQAKKRKIAVNLTDIERKGAAFAEYPYEFKHNGSVQIDPLPKVANRDYNLRNLYADGERKLILKDAFGMAVAMFDYDNEGKRIHCVSFAGTRLKRLHTAILNSATDLFQILSLPSVVYFAAVGILNAVMKTYKNEEIYVFGHSLGGGLTQFACTAMDSDDAIGYGYNSAGLSIFSLNTLSRSAHCRIEHVCSQYDPVSQVGALLGSVKYVNSVKGMAAHKLGQLNKVLNGVELEVRC